MSKKKISIDEIIEFCRDNAQEYIRNRSDSNEYWEIYEYQYSGKFYRYREHYAFMNPSDKKMSLFSRKVEIYIEDREKSSFSLMISANGKELKRSRNSEPLKDVETYLLCKNLNSKLEEKKSDGGKTKI